MRPDRSRSLDLERWPAVGYSLACLGGHVPTRKAETMLPRALGWAFPPLCGAILLAAGAAGQTVGADPKPPPRPLDAQQILSWLPADTETVIVARDFTVPDPAMLEKPEIYTQE